jgi:hypothetical protein
MKQIILIFLVTNATAQLRIEQIPVSPIKSNTGFVLYGTRSLNNEIPYSKINGSPFWNTEFRNATLLISNKSYGRYFVKLNIATNEINFLNNKGEELTAEPGSITKIIFHSSDTDTDTLTVFRNDFEIINSQQKFKSLYVQELNQGNVQLLKISIKGLKVTDSLLGTKKKYSFHLQENYFIKQRNRIYPIKKLSKKEISPLIRINKYDEHWCNKNNINFSIEKDLVNLFDYLNH